MDDYLLFYKERLRGTETRWKGRWDVFVSAFNSSERVGQAAARIAAKQKLWVILPEYGYREDEYPTTFDCFAPAIEDPVEYTRALLMALGEIGSKRIVVDITGFVGHYIPILFSQLRAAGVMKCWVVYSEPHRYLRSERTRFSDEAVLEVRQIPGFEGTHFVETSDDLLVLAVGYDYRLVSEVASDKEHARKIQLFGLPSLRPDMYQESLLRASRASEAVGPDASEAEHFEHSPAHDPFVTASVVRRLVLRHREKSPRANVYLSPLSTKAQVLGFTLFYLRECVNSSTSIIYPFCRQYERETSEGLSGAWLFQVELSNLDGQAVAGGAP